MEYYILYILLFYTPYGHLGIIKFSVFLYGYDLEQSILQYFFFKFIVLYLVGKSLKRNIVDKLVFRLV